MELKGSLIRCTSWCLTLKDCKSFNYNKATGLCVLKDKCDLTLTATTGTDYWK